jgi:hypothetical protein
MICYMYIQSDEYDSLSTYLEIEKLLVKRVMTNVICHSGVCRNPVKTIIYWMPERVRYDEK